MTLNILTSVMRQHSDCTGRDKNNCCICILYQKFGHVRLIAEKIQEKATDRITGNKVLSNHQHILITLAKTGFHSPWFCCMASKMSQSKFTCTLSPGFGLKLPSAMSNSSSENNKYHLHTHQLSSSLIQKKISPENIIKHVLKQHRNKLEINFCTKSNLIKKI